MKLIFCIDKKNGMLFFGKRQSQDSLLRAWILSHTQGSKLWMSLYSARQFGDAQGILADDDYKAKARPGDYCFVEDKPFDLTEVSQVILCHWNRNYQADVFFDVDLKANGFVKTKTEDLVGSSHDKITIEQYERTAQ